MIGIADTLVAPSAGLAIFPIVFAYGLEAGQARLVFVTLTVAFGAMPFGQTGTLFLFYYLLQLDFCHLPFGTYYADAGGGRLTRVKVTVIGGAGAWLLGVFHCYP